MHLTEWHTQTVQRALDGLRHRFRTADEVVEVAPVRRKVPAEYAGVDQPGLALPTLWRLTENIDDLQAELRPKLLDRLTKCQPFPTAVGVKEENSRCADAIGLDEIENGCSRMANGLARSVSQANCPG